MADKKISEFPTFFGTQDEKTYYIVSSGDPGEANSANYRVPFTDLSQAIKAVESNLITATSGVFDVVSGASGIFTGELSISGNPVLTGIEIPGVEGVILGGDEDNINFGGAEPGDNRSVNFQQDGDTKLKINEDGNVEVMQDFYVSGASTLNSSLVTGIFESQSVANFSGPAVNFLGTNNLLGFNNLTGPTNINGSLAVYSPTFDIHEDTITTFSGDTYFKGKSNFQDELNSSSLSKLGGSLTEITSSAFNIGQNVLTNFSGNVRIGGNLYVTGKTVTEEVETVTTSNGVVFEGNALDDFETILKAGTLTADHTITLPDAGGTVALTSDISGGANVTTSTTAPSNPSDGDLWFNGTTGELYVYIDSAGWAQTNSGGAGYQSGDSGHIWRFASEGSAPLLIDQRVLFAPQHHGTNHHSRLYVSDLNGELTQTIFSGPKWPSSAFPTGTVTALRTSIFADWSTATSTNVDVYLSYASSYVLKIQFNRITQTFGTPIGYGVHGGGSNFFNSGWKIAACYDGGNSKHFICALTYANSTHSAIGGANRLEAMEYLSTAGNGYFSLNGKTHYLGDFRPIIKSPDGNQLVEGSGGTGAEGLYGGLAGINHITGRVYYRGFTNGFLYVFQINPSAPGSTYAEKLWNMSASTVPDPVNSNLTYVKTILMPTTGGDVTVYTDATVNFDANGNETGISYGNIQSDTIMHNTDMGILAWNPAWT